jgi:hypothetical protein
LLVLCRVVCGGSHRRSAPRSCSRSLRAAPWPWVDWVWQGLRRGRACVLVRVAVVTSSGRGGRGGRAGLFALGRLGRGLPQRPDPRRRGGRPVLCSPRARRQPEVSPR